MSDEAALLNAIRAHPDEDTPRLVFADWLQEHDQPERAEFIRLQCAHARAPKSDEGRAAYNRSSVLLEKYRKKWFGKLDEQFDENCIIERGFVSRLRGGIDTLRKHTKEIAKYAPVLNSVAVWHAKDRAAEVLKMPFARCVRELSISDVTPNSLKALARAALPANVADLTLFTDHLPTADVALKFLDSRFVRRPARLGLFFNFHTADGDSPTEEVEGAETHNLALIERLTELDLPNLRKFGTWGITDSVAEAIAGWPGLSRVDELLFGLTWIEDDALSTILASPNLGDIKKAFLDENFLGNDVARAIANCPKFATATYLDLAENSIGDAGAAALAESPYLSNLTYLSLWGNDLGKDAQARLEKRFGDAFHS